MTLKHIIDESKNHFMTPEAFKEAFNRLTLAQKLAQSIVDVYGDSDKFSDTPHELVTLAKELLGE